MPEDAKLRDYRLQMLEDQARALGAAVGQVARIDAEIDALAVRLTDFDERCEARFDRLDKIHTEFRREIRDEFKTLRKELGDDRAESRNRTLLALGPIAVAAVGVFAKVVLGIDLPVAH